MSVRALADQLPVKAPDAAASVITSARGAALADRYAVNSLAVEWRSLAELAPIAGQWRALAARALEPNVFYEPAFALAAAPVFARDAGAILVWSGVKAAPAGRLLPGSHRAAALRVHPADPGRLDPRLRPARRTAD